MKNYTILIVFWLCSGMIQAQKITEKHLSFSGKEKLTLDIQIADSINIHTWNKNEVYVKSSVNVNENKDNEAYKISFDESGQDLVVKAAFESSYFKGKKNCCNKTEIYWEVYIPEKAKFTAETIDGNITIKGKTDMMKVKSISGFIDLALPSDRPANLQLSTISGTIYSDHNLTFSKSKSGIPTVIKDKMNNGGPEVNLETISGDIFFRKAN